MTEVYGGIWRAGREARFGTEVDDFRSGERTRDVGQTFENGVLRAWRGQRCMGLPNSTPVRNLETEVSRLRRELVVVRKDLSM